MPMHETTLDSKYFHSTNLDYHALNAQLNLVGEDGKLQLDADKEAVRQFFLQHVNQNTVFFHDLEEKIDYLIKNKYYEPETFEKYEWEFVKSLYKRAYAYKYRFETFLGAFKYYSSYTLKTFDGERYLERFEDRVTVTALYLADGDSDLATHILDEVMSGRLQPATPTFANAGKKQRGELISCFLVRTEDNMESIAQSIASSLQLSKRGGGVALNLTNLRAEGDPIKKIEGQASGVVPVMKLLEDSFSYANQLGSRQGAGAVYLNAHHPDIMKFLDTKRENADEKIRIKTLSLGVVIPDITFQLAKNNEDMYLFSPYDVEQEYGKPFSDISVTELYYEMVDNPNIRKKKINARTLFMTLAEIQFESGYPYILFEDTANRANPIEGRINMSNLCVTGDTRILTDMGYKKIADLYESQAEFNVVADNRAKNMDISAVGNSVVASSKVFKTADNAEVFELTTHTGHKIRATEWHKFYVKRDGNVVKVPLTEVREHDVLLIQKDVGVFGSIHDPKAAYVAGVVAARGTYLDGNLHFQLSIFDNPSVQRFYECAESVTNGFAESLTEALGRKGMTEGAHRLIPEFVWCGDEKTQERFIAGVVESSATVDKSSLKIVGGEDFMRDLQKLLLNHGIYTRVFEDRLVATYDDARELVSLSECHDVEVEEGRSLSTGFAMVKSIAAVGREDVFDVTVEDGHSLIFNGIVTGNCSEILQVNTPSTYYENGSYDTIGRDISCNLASLNVANAFDSPDFALTVETAVRALTSVSDLSNIESVPSVKRGNDASHAIGLGQMNLHGFLAREHMHYDSEEARDFANLYFYTVTYNAIRASHKIAKERGETFEGFENSKYATGEYFDKYVEKDWSKPETQRVRELLKKSNMVIPTPEDWKRLRDDVMRDGIYNAYLQAVPPTGSISYINNSTSSIHPIVAPIEIRKEGKLGRVYYPVPYLSDETLPYYLDAYKIGPKAIIDMYAVATQHIDQGLSLTLFYPTTATTRDLNRSYVYAFSKGIKTLYYMRTRGEALAGTEVSGTAAEYCESCQL